MKDIEKAPQQAENVYAFLRNAINTIYKKYGSADKELIELKIGDKVVKLWCYTQEDWEALHKPVNQAVRLFGKHVNGYPAPNLILSNEEAGWKYYMEILKN